MILCWVEYVCGAFFVLCASFAILHNLHIGKYPGNLLEIWIDVESRRIETTSDIKSFNPIWVAPNEIKQ